MKCSDIKINIKNGLSYWRPSVRKGGVFVANVFVCLSDSSESKIRAQSKNLDKISKITLRGHHDSNYKEPGEVADIYWRYL